MTRSAAACAERATGDILIAPDWAINMELCDIINMHPWQAKDALKIIKKRLGSKRPIIQLLTLSVLDAIIKNCGENVIKQIIEREILLEMAKIVKKKPNINVREKILILIDTWQEAIGVKFPQFIQTFYALRDSGIEFPPREGSTVTLFAVGPPQVQPSGHSSSFKYMAIPASLQDNILPLSMSEMQTAQELADVLMEMLGAVDPNNSEVINQELIVELTEQCQGYQKRVLSLVNNTSDESLLFQGLALNDILQRVHRRREEIANRFTLTAPAEPESYAPPFTGIRHWEDESEDDLSHLAPRSQTQRSTSNTEATQAIPYVAPPFFTRKPNSTDTSVVDYLSGDVYKSDRPFGTPKSDYSSSGSKIPSAPPSPFRYDKQPLYDELASLARPSDPTAPPSWEPLSTTSLPPPPAKNDQPQQFLEQQGDCLNSRSASGSSYDNLFPSHHSKPPRDKESEDALFKDLVDFAKARTSPASSTSKSNRSY